MTFEERLAEVETIAAQLEEGKLGLEESMKKYEQGVQMLTALEKELGSAKQRLSMIQKDASGQPVKGGGTPDRHSEKSRVYSSKNP